jgi:hypothetical protein
MGYLGTYYSNFERTGPFFQEERLKMPMLNGPAAVEHLVKKWGSESLTS